MAVSIIDCQWSIGSSVSWRFKFKLSDSPNWSQPQGGVSFEPQHYDTAIIDDTNFLHLFSDSLRRDSLQHREPLVPSRDNHWVLGAFHKLRTSWGCGSKETPPCGPQM